MKRFPKISGDNSGHFRVLWETLFRDPRKTPEKRPVMFSGPKSSQEFWELGARLYTMAAKQIKSLELHYTMIQLL